MAINPNQVILEPDVSALLRLKAWKIWKATRVPLYDVDDIQHELKEQLLKRLYRYDPARRELDVFIRMVVSRLSNSLFRKIMTEVRHRKRHADADPDLFVGSTHRRRRSDIDWHDLQKDLEAIIPQLPTEQRKLVMLLRTLNKSDAAGLLGCSRSAVYTQVKLICKRFEAGDLRSYLE